MNLSSQYVILIDICLWTVLYVQNLFLLFCYYLPLEKRVALLLAHCPNSSLVDIGLVVMEKKIKM